MLIIMLVTVCASWFGFLTGFYHATGTWPTFREGALAMVPTELNPLPTVETQETVAGLKDKEYGEGYNCLDYAWEGMRLLQWQGQPVVIVRLDLEPDPDHAILLVGTSDQGWQFLEPQTGKIVRPAVGGRYGDLQLVKAIDIMTITWRPLADYIADTSTNTTEYWRD